MIEVSKEQSGEEENDIAKPDQTGTRPGPPDSILTPLKFILARMRARTTDGLELPMKGLG